MLHQSAFNFAAFDGNPARVFSFLQPNCFAENPSTMTTSSSPAQHNTKRRAVATAGGIASMKGMYVALNDGVLVKVALLTQGVGETGSRVVRLLQLPRIHDERAERNPSGEEIDDYALQGQASQIQSLILADNSLTSLPKMDAMTNLETLDLSENALKSIPDNVFANTKKLRRLRFRGNKICKLSPNALNETKDRLEFLDLSHNCLDEVPAQNLRGSQKLLYLDLSHNQITKVPSLRFMNLPALTELRLNSNGMEQLHPLAFMNVPSLEELLISDNKLSSLDTNRFQSFSKLSTLDLSKNNLIKLQSNSFQNIPGLRQLILDDNQIESVETLAFSSLPSLQVISLQNNGLQRIYRNAFDALPSLTSLLLINNSIDDLGEGILAGMPALQQLILNQNKLTALSQNSFDGVTQLTNLDLSENQLTTIGENTFDHMSRLFWLDLSGNQLSGLPKDSLPGKVSNLLLQSNPLICDESLDWLIQYLVSNAVRTFLPNQQDITCAGPPEKRGTLLKDLMLQRANETFFNRLQSGPNLNSFQLNNLNVSTSAINAIQGNVDQTGANGQPQATDLIKSLPQLAAMLGGNGISNIENIDMTKLPPEIIRYVSQGGQIPGVSKEMLQSLTQRYIAQMVSKNASVFANSANGHPTPRNPVVAPSNPSQSNSIQSIPVLNPASNQDSSIKSQQANLSLESAPLPPLSSLSPELIQKVLNGGTIPGFTAEDTEVIKRRYMQQILTVRETDSTTAAGPKIGTEPRPLQPTIQPSSSSFNFSDLQTLNIDLNKIPPDVLGDLAAGKTPDFGKIPQDIIRTIMEKRPMLFGEIVSRELRTRIPQNATSPTDFQLSQLETLKKRPTYDVNDLDKKADISVLGQDGDNPQLTIWSAIVSGTIGTITIIAVIVLCWRRRVGQLRTRIARQTEDTSDTSRFFDNPFQNGAPEPTPRRSKMRHDELVKSINPGVDNLIFTVDSSEVRPNVGPIPGMDIHRQLNQNYFDTMTRTAAPIHQFVGAPSFQTQQHFSPPPLPNRPPTRSAVFDHSTCSWMFVPPAANGATTSNEYHRRIDL